MDDERNIRRTLKSTLTVWGHEVVEAESADEARRCLETGRYDFMLTDFKLGGKSGIDLVRAAKEVDPNLVSVLMTAFASFDNAVNAIKEGAYDYLPKPFSNAQLEHVLTRVSGLSSPYVMHRITGDRKAYCQ